VKKIKKKLLICKTPMSKKKILKEKGFINKLEKERKKKKKKKKAQLKFPNSKKFQTK